MKETKVDIGRRRFHERGEGRVILHLMRGSACPLARGPRARGFMTGLTASSPISKLTNMMRRKSGLWTRGLLIRRNIGDGDIAFFTTWCPAGTSIQALASVEGHRWASEDSFETAKNELGQERTRS